LSKKLIFKCPINGLSLGNVSVNILYELYKKEIETCLLPVGKGLDLTAFDLAPTDFKKWIESCVLTRLKRIKRTTPFLNLWHINGSEAKVSDRNVLYTFYETTSPTEEEVNLVNLYDATCFSSKDAAEVFESSGCENPLAVPLGFDPFTKERGGQGKDKIHFGLIGKWEKRKHTSKIIQIWAEQYGNNFDYELSCLVNNKFLSDDQIREEKANALKGGHYGNINFLPWLERNSQVNALQCSTDIDLSGMSGAEGWNLPAFNATALGKWSVVLNASSHKDWANKDNSILVEPNGSENIEDGIFFVKNSMFNMGEKYTFDEEDLKEAMKYAETVCKQTNTEGIKLQSQFTYSKMVDKLLEICES
jgi:hypothetical protein